MIGIYQLLSILSMLVLAVSGRGLDRLWYPKGEGRCQGCAYDLAGLPEGMPCPECGRRAPGAAVLRRARGVGAMWVVWRVLFVWLLAFGAHAAIWPLVWVAYQWSYWLQGRHYSPTVIANAMLVRKFDLDWEAALIPLGAALSLCCLCCLLDRRAKFVRMVSKIMLVGCLVSVGWLFAQTYVTYR